MKLGPLDTSRAVDIARQLRDRVKAHNASVASAGVAFFGVIALVPALVAVVSTYGLVADPDDIEQQILDLTEGLPEEASALISQQMSDITGGSSAGLGFGIVIGIVLALYSASAAVKNLITTLNISYERREDRGFVALRGTALLFTLGSVIVIVVAGLVLTVLPSLLADTGLGDLQRQLVSVLRFPALAVALGLGLVVLYRYGPDHGGQPTVTRPGAVLAATVWLVASVAFGIYSANFGNFNETYGALGAVVALMLWLYLGAFAVVLGAELNALLAPAPNRHSP